MSKKTVFTHKSTFKIYFLSILSFILLLFASSCAEIPQKAQAKKEMPSPTRFDDIPVPPGFNYLQDNSFVFESANMRIGSLAYEGKMEIHNVLDFYKNTMPQYEWKLVSIYEYKGAIITFTKEGWNTLISITKTGSNTLIYINVGPTMEEESPSFMEHQTPPSE